MFIYTYRKITISHKAVTLISFPLKHYQQPMSLHVHTGWLLWSIQFPAKNKIIILIIWIFSYRFDKSRFDIFMIHWIKFAYEA